MHRSTSYSSTGRSSDEFSVNFSPAALKGLDSNHDSLTGNKSNNHNANGDLVSDDISKKDISSRPSPEAEKAIHLIPLVLFICFLILYLFSSPVTPDIKPLQ
ncbi:periplasmic trehalase [Striga asiatica]|uniref:Periplasmic trehalase n=1 Tax=Striga asiatica TaxID=4170 RepID=A0A5A7RHU8_STRAF|nr:periplasmic trehalase [Striga asiatica]